MKPTYVPVISIFVTSALLTLATGRGLMGFMGYSLTLFALQKFVDLSAFEMAFAKYDLIAKKMPFFGKVFPVIEMAVGLAVLASVARPVAGVLSLLIGLEGSVSVVKAVYFEKKEITCACAGGNTGVPLGFVSLIENILLALMGAHLLVF